MNYHLRRMTVACVAGAIALSTGACRAKKEYSRTAVFSYAEFGPQAAVYRLIGMEWYQWNTQGPDKPEQSDDVKVVVYRNLSLGEVQRMFPTVKHKQDFRYLSYSDALRYLTNHENDPLLTHLKKTKKNVLNALGPEE